VIVFARSNDMSFLRSIGAGSLLGISGLLAACLLFAAFAALALAFHTGEIKDVVDNKTGLVLAGFGLGSFLVGTVAWHLVAEGRPSPVRGGIAGALAGAAAHPFCWFFILLWDGSSVKDLLILPWITGGMTLTVVGWATVPVPMLAGALLGSYRRRRIRPMAEPSRPAPAVP